VYSYPWLSLAIIDKGGVKIEGRGDEDTTDEGEVEDEDEIAGIALFKDPAF
jgi:hypothetical protein